MLKEGTVSLRDAIITEIDQSYRMIDIVGKHHSSILLGFLSLIGIIGISTVANLLSEWIYASNVFFIGVVIVAIVNNILYISKNRDTKNNATEISQTQKANNPTILVEASLINFEFIIKSLGVIFFANLIIILLLSYVGSLPPEDYNNLKNDLNLGENLTLTDDPILNEKISMSIFLIPAPSWFILQAFCFLIISWIFISKNKMIQKAVRYIFLWSSWRHPLKKTQNGHFSLITVIIFLFSILFVGLSHIIFIFNKLHVLFSNCIIIGIILVVQIVIFALLIDYFSSNVVLKHYLSKLNQLNIALAIIERSAYSSGHKDYKMAENCYHISRLFSPIKMNWLIFFSNYLLIPNVAYLEDGYQDLITQYLWSE